jgi:hypothetical protein
LDVGKCGNQCLYEEVYVDFDDVVYEVLGVVAVFSNEKVEIGALYLLEFYESDSRWIKVDSEELGRI